MATGVITGEERFDPRSFNTFRFVACDLDRRGRVRLDYALDDDIRFTESVQIPTRNELIPEDRSRVAGLLNLLHWVAGVSYYKTAAPPSVRFDAGIPTRAVAELLAALYSEGLGQFAYENQLPLPHPSFGANSGPAAADHERPAPPPLPPLHKALVPVGGGKDSAVAIEIVRRSGLPFELFSVGDAVPIRRTAAVAGVPHLVATRRLDPNLGELNRAGALNGHIPITAIVSCIALLTAALNGFDAVVMANERSASKGNVEWDGVTVNHQFSKGLEVERLLRAAVAETAPDVQIFSVLRPASELSIARAFARMTAYHDAFTSCNTLFRLDPALRGTSWCRDCPKCRFVFLVLAPFSDPAHLSDVFGADLLDDDGQFAGFALLTATGGHKPFECVGEEAESLTAIRLLAADPRWCDHRVVRRFVAEVPAAAPLDGEPEPALELSDSHEVPPTLISSVRAILGA